MQKCKKLKGYFPSLTTNIHNENVVTSVRSLTHKYIHKNYTGSSHYWEKTPQTKKTFTSVKDLLIQSKPYSHLLNLTFNKNGS